MAQKQCIHISEYLKFIFPRIFSIQIQIISILECHKVIDQKLTSSSIAYILG